MYVSDHQPVLFDAKLILMNTKKEVLKKREIFQ